MGTEIQRLIIHSPLPLEAHRTIGETSRYTNNLQQCGNHAEIRIKDDGIIYNYFLQKSKKTAREKYIQL